MFAANGGAVSGDKTYIEDVFATTLYTGSGTERFVNTGLALVDGQDTVEISTMGSFNLQSSYVGPITYVSAYKRYVYVALGVGGSSGSGYPYYSTDGLNWTNTNVVLYSNVAMDVNSSGLVVTVGGDITSNPGTASASYSTNGGVSWTNVANAGIGAYADVCVDSAGAFVAVGRTWLGDAIYGKSTNGSTWTNGYMTGTATAGKMTGVAVNSSGLFVAVGEAGMVARSTDGTTWTTPTSIGSYKFSRIIVNKNNVFIALATDANSKSVYLSTSDGITWSSPSFLGGSSGAMSGVDLTMNKNGMMIAIGAKLYTTSFDGVTWTTPASIANAATDAVITSVTSDDNGDFVVMGSYSTTTYVPQFVMKSTLMTNGSAKAPFNGGMVWLKNRSGTATDHAIYDTVRGATKDLVSNSTAAQTTQPTGLTAFVPGGLKMSVLAKLNTSGTTYTAWNFKKAPKFFDVVTYSGNGVSGRVLNHSLGQIPGMVIIKCTNAITNWLVWHRSFQGEVASQNTMYLNTIDAVTSTNGIFMSGNGTVSSTQFGGLGNYDISNLAGNTYVAYFFAHDTTTDGLIQCGSWTTGTNGDSFINLGWEPQYVLVKRTDTTSNWTVYDNMRGLHNVSADTGYGVLPRALYANTSGAEAGGDYVGIRSTGFNAAFTGGGTYIYMAIRRGPMRTPTDGTKVFQPITRTGTGAIANITTNFNPVDAAFVGDRNASTNLGQFMWDRLRGPLVNLITAATTQESSSANTLTGFDQSYGVKLGADATARINGTSSTYANWMFKRAPGFFDVVCYTDLGTVPHNLGVKPELVIYKSRNNAIDWNVDLNNYYGYLNKTNAFISDSVLASRATSTTWQPYAFTSGANMVAYLFATCPGVSKVGTYTGNGTNQTINCGFSAGARFILIKRTDSTGDWYVWDTARGIVAATDPHLSLNTTAAEVTTDDTIDPASSGFIVNQVTATNVNVNAATYIYLAIA